MAYRLLDLFCGPGGMSKGYTDAGFTVTGVDVLDQKSYPFEFVMADALDVLADKEFLAPFDAIHASPPCQAFTRLFNPQLGRAAHADLVEPVRDLLKLSGKPYVIENVPLAPLIAPVTLCGSSFGLRLRRHRLFEASFPLVAPPCDHAWQDSDSLYRNGHHDNWHWSGVIHGDFQVLDAINGDLYADAFEIDWMRTREMRQAIPPAYGQYVGARLSRHLDDVQRVPTWP